MRVKLYVILFILLSFVNAKAEIIDRVIAVVDNKIVTLYDLNKIQSSIRAYPDMFIQYKNLETKEEKDHFLLDLLIEDLLIEIEMEKYGISASDDEARSAINDLAAQNGVGYDDFIKKVAEQGLAESDYKVMIKKQIEKMKYYSRFINSKVTVTDKEILTFFRERKSEFKDQQKIGFTHILFLKNGDDKETLKLTEDFLRLYKESSSIQDATAPFLENSSVRISANISIKKKDLAKEFSDPIEKIEPGEATEIIENDSGYNIIVLKEVEIITLDSLRDRITKNIQREKRNKVYRSMLSKLKQEHSIEKRY
jgi:peptidyl-prolyl cis-trans isomerase SurA